MLMLEVKIWIYGFELGPKDELVKIDAIMQEWTTLFWLPTIAFGFYFTCICMYIHMFVHVYAYIYCMECIYNH